MRSEKFGANRQDILPVLHGQAVAGDFIERVIPGEPQEPAMDGSFCPLVSIITPTYNHEPYIRDCIEGVLSQTYPHWEQVIIDDGSTDRTHAIISQFRDPRIHYYHQKHKGIFRLAETYNRALDLSRGSLIAMLEGDDIWPADRLAALVPSFADSRVAVSYGVCRGFASNGKPVPLVIPSEGLRKLYGPSALWNDPPGTAAYAMLHSATMVASAAASVIRRATLADIGGFQHVPGLPAVDYPTFLELGLRGTFSFTDTPVCYWRAHGGNVSSLHDLALAHGVYCCAMEFVARYPHPAQIPWISAAEIRERWERGYAAIIAFLEGRRLLAGKRWKEARARFHAAFRARGWKVRAAACCGLAASYLQFDLEPLMRLAGRPDRGGGMPQV